MPAKVLSLERIAAARALYDDASISVEVVRRFLNLGPATFARCRAEWGWPPRLRRASAPALADAPEDAPEDAAADAGVAEADTVTDPEPPQDLAALALRLEAMIGLEVLRAEQQMKKTRPSPAVLSRHTRAIASLTRSLAQIRQLTRSGDDGQHDSADSPAALNDLHAELARRVDRLRGAGDAAAADAGSDPQAA